MNDSTRSTSVRTIPAPAQPRADFFEITRITHTIGRTSDKHAQRVGDAAYHQIAVRYRDCEGSATEYFTGYDPTSPTLAHMNAERDLHQWLTRCNGWQALEVYEGAR